MEYNIQRHSTGDLEEVVGEIFIADQNSKRYYAGIIDYVKINASSFVAGILMAFGHAILNTLKENGSAVFSGMFLGVTAPYLVRFTEKVSGVELPKIRTSPVFAGALLGEMLIKYLK